MSTERNLTYSDLTSARERRDPQFARLVIRYLEQPDPPENAPEEPPAPTQVSEGQGESAASEAAAAREPAASSSAGSQDDSGDDDEDFDDEDFDDDDDDFDDDDEDFDDDDDEDFDDDDDEDLDASPQVSGDAWTLARLRSTLAPHNMWRKTDDEKRTLRREAWSALLAAPHPPPRLFLGGLLRQIYDEGTDWARASLIEIFGQARLGWGSWQGFKRIYKLAEERHDAELFGLLAWRLDAMTRTRYLSYELSGATLAYMRRRAWRYLRQLGQAVPELYPQFAVQVLRHYPADFRFSGSWVANQIWAHEDLKGARSAGQSGPPAKLDRRAFDSAWKLSSDPLLRLLEDAHNDHVCDFAIRSLRADFPEVLREVDPRWLARIGKKPLASVHEFVVQVLRDSPAMHQAELAKLGLHDMVLGLLASPSDKASAYAVEYAKAHAPSIPVDDLVRVAEDGTKVAREFARARLAALTPAALGLPALVRMLAVDALHKLAVDKLEEGFKPGDLTPSLYVALANGSSEQQRFVQRFYERNKQKVPAAFLRAQLEDPELSSWQRRRVLDELGKRKAADIGIAWIQEALLDPRYGDQVAEWLSEGMLKGDELDVDWVKGLAMRPSRRALALELLGNTKLVALQRIGLPWLLAMARQADESLSSFAHRYLLEHVTPDDFAREAGSTDTRAKVHPGIDRIWTLLAPGQPEPVRRFAAAYLEVHHPELGPTTDEARNLGIKPRLPREAYALARVRPLFDDASAAVRKLARSVGRYELLRWGEPALLYELARSPHREGRALAAEALLAIGEADADAKLTPPVAWLEPDRVFALTESPVKAAREIALTLIRRHYDRLGGVHRLSWLMESPDREVRLAAVRLLWEKHRPLAHEKAAGTAPDQPARQRFESVEALREFVRTVMFGLPPGRMERREGSGDALPDRPLSASRAKRRLIEVVRDLAVEGADFAEVVVPVLEEFVHSQAKGEWQGCVAALARIRRAHPGIAVNLPQPVTPPPAAPRQRL